MIKRSFDFFASFCGLLVLSPLFVVLALLIKLGSKGPVFFRQVRVGQYGRDFRIYKFRSMRTEQPKKSLKITVGKDPRITRIGHILRHYKLDELPQLLNVLRGDMSLVGPRPEVPKYVKMYSARDREIVLSVKPGITGIAAIRFRSEGDALGKESDPEKAYIEKILPKKLRYYRFYVAKQNFFLDLQIIFKTLGAI
ncbi:MAG: sugar transferase [Alphaproteobacteria bacterium]